MTVESTTPWIEMKDVSVCAPGDRKPKAAGINWRLFPGDFWVVGGLHGSGKSSWINTAAMLQRCLEGEHFVGGREISTLSEYDLAGERKRVGLVFDGGGRPFSRMTVAENVALPLCYHSDTAIHEVMDEVRLLLHLVGLEGFGEKSASALGMNTQQRVAFARAIALRPDLLFLDNPLTLLNPREMRWWLETISSIHRGHPDLGGKPVTMVVTTDDLRPWLQIGTRFGVLANGRWESLGAREELPACQSHALKDLIMSSPGDG